MTMHDCSDGEMRDLLPGYANGVLSAEARDRVRAHVAGCEDCAAEVELIRTVGVAYPTPKVDVARIIASLPAPARQAYRGGSRFRTQQWRIAAGIAMIAMGGISVVVLRSTMHSASTAITVPAPVAVQTPVASTSPAVQPSTPTELAQRAPQSPPVVMGELSFGGGLSDLSDAQLKSLLREIDALDGAPSTEPEVHATPIVPAVEPSHERGTHG